MCRRFFKTFLAGGVLGFIVGLFLAPKPGKELQEDAKKKLEQFKKLIEEKEIDKKVKKIFGEVTKKTKEAYFSAQMAVVEGLAELKGKWEEFDRQKYAKFVKERLRAISNKVGLEEGIIEKLMKKFEKERKILERLAEKYLKSKEKEAKQTRSNKFSRAKKK